MRVRVKMKMITFSLNHGRMAITSSKNRTFLSHGVGRNYKKIKMANKTGNYTAFYVGEPFNPSALGAHATLDFSSFIFWILFSFKVYHF
jgi:hypothetical protein